VIPSRRTTGSEHKLKRRRVPLNSRKHLFTVRATEDWSRLPRKVVKCPFLEIFQRCLDMVLGSLL